MDQPPSQTPPVKGNEVIKKRSVAVLTTKMLQSTKRQGRADTIANTLDARELATSPGDTSKTQARVPLEQNWQRRVLGILSAEP